MCVFGRGREIGNVSECVCVWDKREGERVCVCACVCVWKRAGEREREREIAMKLRWMNVDEVDGTKPTSKEKSSFL